MEQGLSDSKWYWADCTATHKRMKLGPYHTWCSKINSHWIKDLNLRGKTMKFLDENRTIFLTVHLAVILM